MTSRATPKLSGPGPRDARARVVLDWTKEPSTDVLILALECGHSEFRKYRGDPPARVICTHCPAAGGFGNSDGFRTPKAA